jgi:hypothetical protein
MVDTRATDPAKPPAGRSLEHHRMGVAVRVRPAVAVVAVLGLVAVIALLGRMSSWDGKLPLPMARECQVRAGGQVALTAEQMSNAATIAAVGIRREMPERAVVVALATAYQESKLENLPNGDRDSVGLFQQRESQGWGPKERLKDPRYAANRFYSALRKVKGWRTMRVTDAAQRVQRSAFPEAYEKWADEAGVLAKALLGRATGAVACTVKGKPAVRGVAAMAALGESLALDWGRPDLAAPDVAAGLAVPVSDERAGWRFAHWMVSHAIEHGVQRVRFGNLEWYAPSGRWQTIPAQQVAGAGRVVAEVFG